MTPEPPQLSPGAPFGPYRVDALVGAGGMGQVYRATDPRLHRTVALKVLPPGLADDPDFDARFEREARLLASLSHPNIAAIYGLEEAGGVQGLVLEFIEGPTLAERIARGRLPIAEALSIAKQIAQALEAAHEKGIIHRDLKPANIKIATGGVVKVLDFGIATVTHAESRASMADTRTGVILGTPAYMSPEQARGQAVDKRTDTWAFGCVLYEMLTGASAFGGATASDSLAKVIEREPDWSALPKELPASIHRLISRCLRKDAGDRQRDIADARIEIADAMASPRSVDTPPAIAGTRRASLPSAVIAAGLVLAIGAWALWKYLPRSTEPATSVHATEFGVTFPNNYIPAFGVAVSPDGRYLAAGVFVNFGELWLHSFDKNETRPIPGTGGGTGPFWSPDSSRLGFAAGGNLMTIGVAGGTPTFVAPAPTFRGGTWNQEGVLLFSASDRLYRVPASGTAPPVEVPLSGTTGSAGSPVFLPDGRHFIFTAFDHGRATIQLASLDSARVTTLVPSDAAGTFAAPDRVLFLRRASLMAQKLDLMRFVLEGDPQIVTTGVMSGMANPRAGVSLSASETGMLTVTASRGGSAGQLTWFTREGRPDGSLGFPAPDNEFLNPAISPDGTKVAAAVSDPALATSDIWLVDPTRGVSSKLTSDPAWETDPVWSPDGKEIAYVVTRDDGRFMLYRQSISGGAPEQVADLSRFAGAVTTDWSRACQCILLQAQLRSAWSIWAVPLTGDRQPQQIVDERFGPYGGHLSPDGRWLAYNAFEANQYQIYVRPFRGDAPKVQVSHDGGVHPRWTRDGKELVYWTPPGGIFANDITITGSDVHVGPTRTLVDRPVLSLIDGRPHYDITRDGRRLLVRQPTGVSRPGVRVFLSWMSHNAK